MQIYNLRSSDQNTRLLLATVCSLLAGIGMGIIYALVVSWIGIALPIFYVAMALIIAQIMRQVGRGVSKGFSIAGAICCTIAIITSLLLMLTPLNMWIVLFDPSYFIYVFRFMLIYVFNTNVNQIINLLIMVMAVYLAYDRSRIF